MPARSSPRSNPPIPANSDPNDSPAIPQFLCTVSYDGQAHSPSHANARARCPRQRAGMIKTTEAGP